ncbi:MAG: site-specific DNA-methyltransferase [Phycisphaerae bacterium]|nr:site-specific DNA-methyltransferase [Phycisphaerae bacterium]
MREKSLAPSNHTFERLAKSALDRNRIVGLTHNFYRYPARFSPTFASTAIKLFSKPCDIVLDPYMGGGTTIVEAVVAGRQAIGTDLNSLSVFLTKVKTTQLTSSEKKSLLTWSDTIIPQLSYRQPREDLKHLLFDPKTKNLTLSRARFIKKVVACALHFIDLLPSQNAKDFARCAILKTSQWALDGRKTHTTLKQFRYKLKQNLYEMLEQLYEFECATNNKDFDTIHPKLFETDASFIDKIQIFAKSGIKADLVVTSPPYPGLHILYHRWQVDGRRETPAPYWIAGCQDGQGDSFYNFGSRHQPGLHSYFESSLLTLKAIRRVMRRGAYIIQMLSFSNPEEHLPRYLTNMENAGFKETKFESDILTVPTNRIWRIVPNRKWHANLNGKTSGSREVVLIHEAI